jgi:hypothetical protein
MSVQFGTCRDMSGSFGTFLLGQDGKVGTGWCRSELVDTSREMSGHVRTCRYTSEQVRTGRDMSRQVVRIRSGPIGEGWVRSGQVGTGRDTSEHGG